MRFRKTRSSASSGRVKASSARLARSKAATLAGGGGVVQYPALGVLFGREQRLDVGGVRLLDEVGEMGDVIHSLQ
jgi:hypothetical protein